MCYQSDILSKRDGYQLYVVINDVRLQTNVLLNNTNGGGGHLVRAKRCNFMKLETSFSQQKKAQKTPFLRDLYYTYPAAQRMGIW